MSTLGDRELSTRLRAHVRARLNAGTLPRLAVHHRVYAGYGEGQTCSGCGQPIRQDEVLYEIEAPAPPPLGNKDPGGSPMLSMHLHCFDIWVEESRSASRGADPPINTCVVEDEDRPDQRHQHNLF